MCDLAKLNLVEKLLEDKSSGPYIKSHLVIICSNSHANLKGILCQVGWLSIDKNHW